MVKHQEYRRFALLCLELANTAPSPADRTHLLSMAEAWLDLASARAGSRATPFPKAITPWSEGHWAP